MADSVDRVFVHALNTVKKIPRSGSTRPPASDRLRLYGLYKQAMEGDVDGVMERPSPSPSPSSVSVLGGLKGEDLQRERDKWDAWNSQKGLGRTEAKRRYIEVLIETMHKYATSEDGQELISELEFVWNQIRNNTPSSSPSSPRASSKSQPSTFPIKHESSSPSSPSFPRQGSSPRKFQQPLSGADGPMKVLSPMSEQDEAEMRSIAQFNRDDDEQEGRENEDEEYADADDGQVADTRRGAGGGTGSSGGGGSIWWSRTVERALVSLSAEVAALREQITTSREWRSRKKRAFSMRLGSLFWAMAKHLVIDLTVLSLVLLWMRRRKDPRLEDLVRGVFRLGREYLGMLLPART